MTGERLFQTIQVKVRQIPTDRLFTARDVAEGNIRKGMKILGDMQCVTNVFGESEYYKHNDIRRLLNSKPEYNTPPTCCDCPFNSEQIIGMSGTCHILSDYERRFARIKDEKSRFKKREDEIRPATGIVSLHR